MAKWSEIYKKWGSNGRVMSPNCSSRELVRQLLEEARFTPPAKAKRGTKGGYPHLQPFFKNQPKKLKAAA